MILLLCENAMKSEMLAARFNELAHTIRAYQRARGAMSAAYEMADDVDTARGANAHGKTCELLANAIKREMLAAGDDLDTDDDAYGIACVLRFESDHVHLHTDAMLERRYKWAQSKSDSYR